ncbi:probable aspartic proteinase GIP2 [Ricinus communis]|uniref:Basic 7S globulin 2 small subunit, putative n=1 Tax=Ricinus communis TaxID=3988 RepID=B9RTU8_RICCO|nr:probable aspartic proteinase GIP2 [Ricinus communis]EEF45330.1 basic 7S globulin 2 precursor small subunit, putative [Ricinus communis]|eukprot:XP_002517167.1 basic 7S globulin [Ricinus communis]
MSSMAPLLNCFLLFSSILLFISPSAARSVPARPKPLVLPVLKDKCSHQYVTQINQRTPLVAVKLTVDLGGTFMWVDCDNYVSSSYTPVRCDSALCKLADSHSCTTECYSSPKPGCYNNTCSHIPYNPVVHVSTSGDIGLDVVSLQSMDGKYPGRNVSVPNVPFVCGTGFMLENLADGVLGVAGLGRGNISLPAYFSSALGLQSKFAICLSSLTNSSGVIYFGDSIGPLSSDFLIYTPLVRNPVSTAGAYFEGQSSTDYFIAVKTLRVGGKEIKFNKTLLSIDNEGKGGTRISTVHPYTLLHTSIYKAVIKAFAKQMKFLIEVNPPIAPFGLCYQSAAMDINEYGPVVPFIDLVLESQGSVYWRIWGANSMVKISSYVMCLGFVDGGLKPDSSIIIGGRQLEDNLLQFDLASARLGFTSSLLVRNTTCSNFNSKSV